MRVGQLVLWDMRFLLKHGFYFIYAVTTLLYLFVLSAIPGSWREKGAAIMIFSDPAAMGLFFMGAIVLLEKNQRVLNALTISPVKVQEYIVSKVISLCVLSLLVGIVIAIAAGIENILSVLLGTAFASIIFTLFGLIVAVQIKSLNQFMIAVIPIEIVCFIPSLFYLFDSGPEFMTLYPINICMGMIMGQTDGIILKFIVMIVFVFILLWITHWRVSKMWKSMGGVKL